MKPTKLWSNLEGFVPKLCSSKERCQYADSKGRHPEGAGRGGNKALRNLINELPEALLQDLFEAIQVLSYLILLQIECKCKINMCIAVATDSARERHASCTSPSSSSFKLYSAL